MANEPMTALRLRLAKIDKAQMVKDNINLTARYDLLTARTSIRKALGQQ